MTHTLIQVKSNEITKKTLMEILDNFNEKLLSKSKLEYQFIIFTFKQIKLNGSLEFSKSLSQYKNRVSVDFENKEEIRREFLKKYDIDEKYSSMIERLQIVEDNVPFNTEETISRISYKLRKLIPLSDYTDNLVNIIYRELKFEFEKARIERNQIKLEQILNIIIDNVSLKESYTNISIETGYSKLQDNSGYIKQENIMLERQEIVDSLNLGIKTLKKMWWKQYRKEFFKSLLFSAIRCPQCRHPLMANMMGIHGIACPDCGYQPFVTMYYIHTCGHPIIVSEQPDFEEDSLLIYATDFVKNTKKCEKCNGEISSANLLTRLCFVPYPSPKIDINEELKKNYYNSNPKK